MPRILSKAELLFVSLLAVFFIVVFPLLNASGVISNVTLYQWSKYLCYAMLAISVDILWGYTGLLSLGQALFFSLGSYMLGMHLMLKIGKLGSFAQSGQNPNLIPDFLFFLGHTELPTFWKPFHSIIVAGLMVIAIPGLLSLIFGFLAFRSRIKGVYFSILTQALTYGFMRLFYVNDVKMGGNNGFTDFKTILGASLQEPATKRVLYIVTAVTLLLVYLALRWLTQTKFGLVQRAIRDSETRVLFSGYAAANYKLFVFVLSGLISSLAGALFIPQVGAINPSEMSPVKSLEAVVWCAVGGRGTLVGPIIGAISVNALKNWATHAYPDLWLIFLGTLFILVVLFLPKGVVSLPLQIRDLLVRKKAPPDPEPAADGVPAKS